MGDALRAAGLAFGAGGAVAIIVIALKVREDDAKVWFVLIGIMVCTILMLVIVGLAMVRSAYEARASALALSAERSLISARAVRTLDGVTARPSGADFLGQLISGMPGEDVVGHATPSLAWGDDDPQTFRMGE